MRERSLLSSAASLLICGLLAGVVVAAAAFPAVAFTGLTAKAGSDSFENLPADLKIPPSNQISYLYAKDGKTLIAQLYDENRKDIPISDVAPIMQKAMVSAEDTRFYQHHGVDMKGVLRALVANGQSGEVSQGSSTLTMQYVRNVLKNNPNATQKEREEALADTPARKLKEMRYAVALEKKLDKKQILERYLNISFFGHHAYGIYAASETYFSKPPSKLTAGEAAMIAGMVQTPSNDPTVNPKYATQRRNYVLGAMVKMHYISQATADSEKKKPITLHVSEAPEGCSSVPENHKDWGFFCDYVQQWWSQQKAFGSNATDRVKNLKQGGYKIVTSLDPKVQKTAMTESTNVYSKDNPYALPIAAVEPGTGHVLALAVNRNYSYDKNPSGQNNYPNTVNPLITGSGDSIHDLGYQTGSTYKMFTMLAALSAGKPLDTGFNAPVRYTTHYPVGQGPAGCSNGQGGYYYCVTNDNNSNYMVGYRNMWTGFGHSVNTYFVWLEEQVGPQKAVAMAKKLGITFKGDPKQGYDSESGNASDAYLANNADQWGAFTLGVAGTFPLELANAYATLGADGKYCKPLPVLKIVDNQGHSVPAAKANCHQAIDPDIARAATDGARCTVNDTPYYGSCNAVGGSNGTAPGLGALLGDHQLAGKTGSSENNATETFAGFTTQVAAAGVAVDPANPHNYVGSGVSASVDEAVGQTMKTALEGKKPIDFKKESEKIAYGDKGYLRQPPAEKKDPKKKGNGGGNHHGGGGNNGGGDNNGGLPGWPTVPGSGTGTGTRQDNSTD
ncbi:MAG TPA: transglycosylase domain-containing protein [Actinocatenispora sp.]